ncbi:MAG: alpha/beta fold hydrolase [Betaproteobacteria bacterium]|nr:alpha/beta fold hydrolase [Betaproteobacteria bacterium]
MSDLRPQAVFLCAHGAGGHKDDASMRRLAAALEPAGFDVVRFNFPYREKGSRRIDAPDVLKDAFRLQIDSTRKLKSKSKIFFGGRSMGGRIASMLAADGAACDGLLLAAYPLHPAGKPEKLRTAHLPAIRCPVLCLNGTRDPLCERELMEEALKSVRAPWTMHWLEGADHSFHVLKSSGRTDADLDAEVRAAAARWLSSL